MQGNNEEKNHVSGKIRNLIQKYSMIIKYLLFGALTTLINMAAYALLYDRLGVSNVASTVIAWVLAVAFAFITNKLSVFESRSFDRKTLTHEISSFLGARIITGILDTAIMYLAVDVLHLTPIVWKLISNVIVIILNFIASKFFIFQKNNDQHT